MGRTDSCNPVFEDDGCIDVSGAIIGTYLHGLFENELLTRSLLSYACKRKGIEYKANIKDKDPYEELARIVESSLDMGRLMSILENG